MLLLVVLVAGGCGGTDAPAPSRPELGASTDPLQANLAFFAPEVAERIEHARRLATRRRATGEAWFELGMLYEANYAPELALAAFTEALARGGTSARLWYRVALVNGALGHVQAAMDALRETSSRDPTYAPAHWRLGFWQLEQGELDAAQAAFLRATDAAPRDHAGWTGRARVHLQRGENGAAIAALEQVLVLQKRDNYARGLLGIAHRQAGRMDQARALLVRGKNEKPIWHDPWKLELRPYRVETALLLQFRADQLTNQGQPEESLPLLEQLARQNPAEVTLQNKLAAALSRAGRTEDARAKLERCLELEPENRQALINMATVLSDLGRSQEALSFIERALEHEPAFAHAHEIRGALLYRLRQREAAADAYRDAVRHDARKSRLWITLGSLQLELRRWEEAATSFRTVLAAKSKPEATVGLAKAYLMLERPDEARALLAALEQPPADTKLYDQVRRELERRRRHSAEPEAGR